MWLTTLPPLSTRTETPREPGRQAAAYADERMSTTSPGRRSSSGVISGLQKAARGPIGGRLTPMASR